MANAQPDPVKERAMAFALQSFQTIPTPPSTEAIIKRAEEFAKALQ